MSRTEFDVCLVVETASAALADLEKSIGRAPSDGSHDRGTPHLIRSRGVWPTSVWQLCSGCPRATSLEEQFAAIELQLAPGQLRATGTLPADAHVYFSVGLFSDSQVPTATFTPTILAIATSYGAEIETKLYTPDMDT